MRFLISQKRFFNSKPLQLLELTSISPLDGRYASKTSRLRNYFSEFALIKQRVVVETKWLAFITQNNVFPEIPKLSADSLQKLSDISNKFDINSAIRVKEIEKVTNHDLKAVEYFIKEELSRKESDQLSEITEMVHFGCTSEDINNISYALMLKSFNEEILYDSLTEVILFLRKLAHHHSSDSMLSKTHGQPATPTTLGKELANFAVRLARQRKRYLDVPVFGKLNGAVGNFAAHSVVSSSIDWFKLSNNFITSLGLTPNAYTTQIEPHDFIAEFSDALSSYNTVLIDFSKDMWTYISLGYFKQMNVKGEIGSSTMPNKINPIDFENAEGNLEVANALFALYKRKLPVSRLQRDLSDSTVLRTLGVAYGHSMLALTSLLNGLGKLSVNKEKLDFDLDSNLEVLAEPIQMVLRRYGENSPYERLKELTRGKKIDKDALQAFIVQLDLPEIEQSKLLSLSPANYTGISSFLSTNHLDKTLAEYGVPF